MTIRTLILDDSEESRIAAENALAQFPDIEIAGRFSRSRDLFRYLEGSPAHLVFLDIELDQESGFSTARKLRQSWPDLMIVFLTGHSSYAIDGYDFQPVNFLTKPVNQAKLKRTIEEVRSRLSRSQGQVPAQLMFRLLKSCRILDVREICFVERVGRKNILYTETEALRIANYTMHSLEEMMAEYGFFLCHQAFIISLYRVTSVRETRRQIFEVTLRGVEQPIPVSRIRYEELMNQLRALGIQPLKQ